MQCELCGNDCIKCFPSNVDGVKMMLCPGCMKYGKNIIEKKETSTNIDYSIKRSTKKKAVKDIYVRMNKELISNFSEKIKNARIKKKLTREELGFRIGERTVTIGKIENGDLRPSDKIAEKIEKELSISLFEKVEESPKNISHSHSNRLTLGDFIKSEEN
jgi:putative transcription factor